MSGLWGQTRKRAAGAKPGPHGDLGLAIEELSRISQWDDRAMMEIKEEVKLRSGACQQLLVQA